MRRLEHPCAVAAVALAVLLASMGPLYRVRTWWDYDDPLATDAVIIGIFAAVSVTALAGLVRHGGTWRWSPPNASAAAAGGWLLLTTVWSFDRATTLRETLQMAGAWCVGAAIVRTVTATTAVVGTWLGIHAGLAWAFVAIVSAQPGSLDENGDWAGVFFNRNSLAIVSLAGIIASLTAIVRWRDRPPVVAIAGLAMLADLRLLVGTAARTPLLAVVAASVVAALLMVLPPTARRPRAAAMSALLMGLGGLLVGLIGWLTRRMWLDDLGRRGDLTGRVDIWEQAADHLRARPVGGWGYLASWSDPGFVATVEEATGKTLTSAHNSFVEVLIGGGVIGLGLTAAFVGALWSSLVTDAIRQRRATAILAAAILVVLIIENLAETLLVGNHLNVVVLGGLTTWADKRWDGVWRDVRIARLVAR